MAVERQRQALLGTYTSDPKRLEEDANTERSIYEGAYAQRQLFELLQNAADAMRDGDGRCEVILTGHTMYIANSGSPLTVHGVETLMAAHLSSKRDEQIGRFGLGFKSVLAVTDSPQIYSQSGSLGFDREWSRRELSAHFPGQDYYPVTRLAQALDPHVGRAKDPVLDQLMRWASTVVVLPKIKDREHLAQSMKGFPAEFLLFSQHVSRLDVEDRVTGAARRMTLNRADNGLLELDDAGKKSKWVVGSSSHTPSPAAMKDGGYQAARSQVNVSWAAPVEGVTQAIGRFWAYFPTDELTTLSGIINAPWKLADDRERLLEGEFNNEILTGVLPGLVASAFSSLTAERPTAGIDALPARGKEARGHADDIINVPIFEAVAKIACVPNLSGKLRHPTRVKLHPAGLDDDLLTIWAEACPDPEEWVHTAVLNRERRPKIVRLMTPHKREAVTVKAWLEHLARGGSVDGSATAVRLLTELERRKPELRSELRTCKVLLLEDGTLAAPRRGQVFLPGGTTQPGQLIIDSVLAANPNVVRDLKSLGIEILDDAGELRTELIKPNIDWQRVWTASRKLEPSDAETIFREEIGNHHDLMAKLRVRTAAGAFRAPGQVFLPGEIIPGDCSRDTTRLVDPRFHQQDMNLLQSLGLVDRPQRMKHAPDEPWRTARVQEARGQYRKQVGQRGLADSTIEVDQDRVLWPLECLSDLSADGRAAVTRVALRALTGDEEWRIPRIGGRAPFSMVDPTWIRLSKHGALATEVGVQPVVGCLLRGDEVDETDLSCLPYLREHIDHLQAERLGIKHDPGELSRESWSQLVGHAAGWEPSRRFNLYAWAAFCEQPPPARIKVHRGRGHVESAPTDVAVTADREVRDKFLATEIPVMLVRLPHDVETLVEGWGLDRADELLDETISADLAGERYRIVDLFPPLKAMLPVEWHHLEIQPCSRIELLTRVPNKGEISTARASWLDEGILFTTATRTADLLSEVGRATNTTIRPTLVEARMEKQRLNKLRSAIAESDNLHEKLALAIGIDALRSSVPAAAMTAMQRSLGRNLTNEEVARLAVAVDGYSVLEAHAKDLQRNGLEPPSQWAGRSSTRNWVRDLGFPVEYAGFANSRRAAEIEIDGPPDLGPLHDYQQTIAGRIRQLFTASSRTNRGLVSLPTGAGKTRVAVQATVEYMASTEENVRVLWIAETDELCEQAVQTWTAIWRQHGRQGKPLNVSRLWSANETNERDGYQAVIASVSKLDSLFQRDSWQQTYGWLRKPALLVIDEAHKSIGQQYTRILTSIGDAKRIVDIETPLLGLTATPFRGFNEKETTRLVNRYDRRLDEDVFPNDDPYAHLQLMGILASVRQHELEGAQIALTQKEIEDARQFRMLSDRVTSVLAQDEERNNTIVESILGLPESAKVLLFATSVENARVLAALLSYRGVEARAVSAETSASARRRHIEDFKAGQVRVLTNYNVFTEGFDVPAVDAVYITRPTFSPNVYQQMVGRGLRGPLNGGSSDVLIVNVADNLTNYGADFAFRHFDHLWKDKD